jgi:Na+-translocating ferredoxin:NAD+ oxidoreductase subunit D
MNKLTVSPSPHIHSGDSVKKNMYGVIIALVPALFTSVWYFGLGAIVVTGTAIVSCLLFEFLIQKYLLKKEPSITDGSAIITGLLLAFNLPTSTPVALIVIGSAVAIGVGKMAFGGLGNNPFNPALVGRVFLLISFPVQMTSWPIPIESRASYVDATSGATPLGMLKEGLSAGENINTLMAKLPSYFDMFMGNISGSMGEISAAALLIGLLYMLMKRIITWHIPVSVLGSVAALTAILHWADPSQNATPLFHLLTGGVMLGAIFMATDYVTSPMSKQGMIVFGAGIGILTVLIRVFGAYPEGMSFAILIMNGFVPLIDKYMKPKQFGERIKTVKA